MTTTPMPPPAPFPAVSPARPRGRHGRAWVVAVVSTVLGLGALAVSVLIVLTRGPEATAVGLGFAALPVPFLVAAFWWLDRYEPEPWRYLFTALGWGAVMATTLGVAFTALGSQLSGASTRLEGVVLAPFTEELSKGVFVALVVLARRREVDGVLDGIVYAGMVGIGFAFTENVLYYVHVYADGLGGATAPGGIAAATGLFVMRGVIAPFAHPLFTSAIGIGLGLAVTSRRWAGRLLWPLLGYGVAVALHSAWNASAEFGGGIGFLLTYASVMVPTFALVAWLALWVRRREGRVLTTALTDCAHRGWLHPAEVPWIASLSHRATARVYARRHRGPFAGRAVRQYQQAVAELGFLHDRVMRGRPPRDVPDRLHDIGRRIALWRPHVLLPPPLPSRTLPSGPPDPWGRWGPSAAPDASWGTSAPTWPWPQPPSGRYRRGDDGHANLTR